MSRERGSESIEAVIGMTALMLFIALIMAAGRISIAHQSVISAAAEAARAASISRSAGLAQAEASSGASVSLANQSLECASTRVIVDTSGFSSPVGVPAAVTATVSCEVSLADIAIPGLPGSTTITATVSSPLDTYRERN